MKLFFTISFILFYLISLPKVQPLCEPIGVCISLGGYYSNTEISNATYKYEYLKIVFFTINSCSNSYIMVTDPRNSSNLIQNITNQTIIQYNITDNSQGFLNITNQFIHIFKFTQWVPTNQLYEYTIHPNTNSSDNSSKTYDFILPNRDSNETKNILITGMMDISNESSITLEYLSYYAKRMNDTAIDAIIYTGDMAFNLDTQNYAYGNYFLSAIESFTAYIPFMPTAGTRDSANNFDYYNKMLGTPLDEDYNNLFYTFNLGTAHFIQFNMAFYISTTDQTIKNNMFQWLENDLRNAAKRINRLPRPWIIVYGYHSFYCSNNTDIYCSLHTGEASPLINFENLFLLYKVDLYISASKWQPVYERLNPMYNKEIYGFSSYIKYDPNYLYMVNPSAPIYLIEACGGNNLFFNGGDALSINLQSYDKGFYSLRAVPWQGFGILSVISGTQINFTQISSYDYSLEIPDNFTLINTNVKYEEDWPIKDRVTFITAFVVFVVIGSFILIVFMIYIE